MEYNGVLMKCSKNYSIEKEQLNSIFRKIIIMRTFWIYFFIFLSLVILVQTFKYLSGPVDLAFTWAESLKYLGLIVLIASISAFISPKKKKKHI